MNLVALDMNRLENTVRCEHGVEPFRALSVDLVGWDVLTVWLDWARASVANNANEDRRYIRLVVVMRRG
jgi:hypothetical protein